MNPDKAYCGWNMKNGEEMYRNFFKQCILFHLFAKCDDVHHKIMLVEHTEQLKVKALPPYDKTMIS